MAAHEDLEEIAARGRMSEMRAAFWAGPDDFKRLVAGHVDGPAPRDQPSPDGDIHFL